MIKHYDLATALVISFVIGGLRVYGEKSQFFQASAHLWIGFLVGSWWNGNNKIAMWLAIGLTVLEVACFIIDR